jgi:crotonobetainyl-CoA:carnitine CoA-transferase CaiB-like acyl-CoA transferase
MRVGVPSGTKSSHGPTGPLVGLRVLDLSSVIMGPYATQILADLGADVITVESAGGDTNRVMSTGPHPQLSGIALNLLRNKRNVDLDLRDDVAHRQLLELATTCDAVITNLRPASLQRLRLTYADVAAVNPTVVYCQAQGFPLDSPRANDPAYDDIIQAASGLTDAVARCTGRPGLAPTILADKICALTIVYSTLAALLERQRTGQGQHVEIPMIDVAQAFMLVEHGAAAIDPEAGARAGYARILTPKRRPQQTLDGWIHILPYTRDHYNALFLAGGRTDLVDDPRTATLKDCIANSQFLYPAVEPIVLQRTTKAWMAFCRERGIPATELPSLDDLVEALPIAQHPIAGPYRQIPHPVRYSRTPANVYRPAPLIGQHTGEVLDEVDSGRNAGTGAGSNGAGQ